MKNVKIIFHRLVNAQADQILSLGDLEEFREGKIFHVRNKIFFPINISRKKI